MALSDIVSRTRTILYGTGLGEAPAMRLALADAGESISGQLATFSMVAGEGAKIKPSHTLAVYDPATEADAHVLYVTSISTDAVTGVNGYLGSPVVADTDLDGAIFEQNPLVTGFEIFEAIDTIIANYLYPEVYTIKTETIATPDLVDGQEETLALALEVISAHQVIGPSALSVPCNKHPEAVHTTISSTGRLGQFDWFDGSAGFYTYKAKVVEADIADDLLRMVATGAAAITLGGHLVETSIAGTKAANNKAVSQRQAIGGNLWRDFLTMKQGKSEELMRDGANNFIVINRG